MDDGPALIVGCVEEALVGQKDENLERAVKTVPLVLKALFDQDVLDENHIISWFSGKLVPQSTSVSRGLDDEALSNRAKLQSKPLIDWLLADSSDDDDDDDSEDEDSDDSPVAGAKKAADGSDTDSNSEDDEDE